MSWSSLHPVLPAPQCELKVVQSHLVDPFPFPWLHLPFHEVEFRPSLLLLADVIQGKLLGHGLHEIVGRGGWDGGGSESLEVDPLA